MRNVSDSLLAQCLERLEEGFSPEEALADVPAPARAELRPLLELALEVGSLPRIRVPTAVVNETRERVLQRTEALRAARRSRQPIALPGTGWLRHLSRRVAIGLASASAAGGLVIGVAAAAPSSLPASPLYPIKIAAEQVHLAFATDPSWRAHVLLTMAERRIDEAEVVSQAGLPADELVRQAGALLDEARRLARQSNRRELLEAVESLSLREQQVLLDAAAVGGARLSSSARMAAPRQGGTPESSGTGVTRTPAAPSPTAAPSPFGQTPAPSATPRRPTVTSTPIPLLAGSSQAETEPARQDAGPERRDNERGTPTETPLPTPTPAPTSTAQPTRTPLPTTLEGDGEDGKATPTLQMGTAQTPSPTPSAAATTSPTTTPQASGTPQPTRAADATPTIDASATPSASATSSPSPWPTASTTPLPTATPQPFITPTPSATAPSSKTAEPTRTAQPTPTPKPTP